VRLNVCSLEKHLLRILPFAHGAPPLKLSSYAEKKKIDSDEALSRAIGSVNVSIKFTIDSSATAVLRVCDTKANFLTVKRCPIITTAQSIKRDLTDLSSPGNPKLLHREFLYREFTTDIHSLGFSSAEFRLFTKSLATFSLRNWRFSVPFDPKTHNRFLDILSSKSRQLSVFTFVNNPRSLTVDLSSGPITAQSREEGLQGRRPLEVRALAGRSCLL
jgi:hypothetical protein